MSLKWLQPPYPRYLRPQAQTLHLQCYEQEINHLAFVASSLGLQDCIILSDGQARVRVYSVLLGNKTLTCVWQSSAYGSTGPATSFSRDLGLGQGMYIAVAAQRSIALQSLAKLMSTSGDPSHSTITTPLEGCYNIAWDSSGSFIALCTAIRRLRLYHDKGHQCTEVDSVSDTSMAFFAPGDSTMLYCITPQGVKLRSLRALPECADFCQAVDRANPNTNTAKGKACMPGAANHGASGSSLLDHAASCWQLTSPIPAPLLTSRRQANAAAPSCDFEVPSSCTACGCTEDRPCNAACPNMQASSNLLRTPLATIPSSNSQATSGQLAGQHAEELLFTDEVLDLAMRGKIKATAVKTFSGQKRQLGSAGKRKADLSWLQGADETPASSSRPQHTSYHIGAWGSSATVDSDQSHLDSKGSQDAGPKLTNGVVTWYTAATNREKASFDAKTGRYQYSFQGHTGAVTQVLPLQDGLHILTSSSDNTHKLWTVEGKGLCTFKPNAAAAAGFASMLLACQKYVLAGHGSSMFVWDISQVLKAAGEAPEAHSYGNHLLQLQEHDCVVTAVASSQTMMASADSSGKVILRFSF